MKDTVFIADAVRIENIENAKTFLESLSDPSFIIALSAIILSFIAVFISIYYNEKTLTRNKDINTRLNKPILSTKYIRNESDGTVLIELINNGLGPAIIDNISIKYKDKKSDDILDFINGDKIPNTTQDFSYENPNPSKVIGFPIAANDTLKIFSCNINVKGNDLSTLQAVFRYIGQFEFTIKYTDIFENEISLIENLER